MQGLKRSTFLRFAPWKILSWNPRSISLTRRRWFSLRASKAGRVRAKRKKDPAKKFCKVPGQFSSPALSALLTELAEPRAHSVGWTTLFPPVLILNSFLYRSHLYHWVSTPYKFCSQDPKGKWVWILSYKIFFLSTSPGSAGFSSPGFLGQVLKNLNFFIEDIISYTVYFLYLKKLYDE